MEPAGHEVDLVLQATARCRVVVDQRVGRVPIAVAMPGDQMVGIEDRRQLRALRHRLRRATSHRQLQQVPERIVAVVVHELHDLLDRLHRAEVHGLYRIGQKLRIGRLRQRGADRGLPAAGFLAPPVAARLSSSMSALQHPERRPRGRWQHRQ
jgi:hypothetical protein